MFGATCYNRFGTIFYAIFVSYSSRKYEEDALPFDTKPRIARTPLHIRHQSSSDVTVAVDSPREMPGVGMHVARDKQVTSRDKHAISLEEHVTSHKTSAQQNEALETEVKKKKNMEIVGHAFDSAEKKANQTMHSTLGSTSGIGSSLEESGELKTGFDRLLKDGKENATLVEDVYDYELDYEEDTESEEDPSISDDRHLKDGKLLKDYEKSVVDRLDQDDRYSDTMEDDGSDGESLEDSEGYGESDEDDGKELLLFFKCL